MAVRALKRHTLYDLWPYKRRNNEGSIAQKWRPVDLIKIHLHTKFERNLLRNVAVRALKRHTLYDLWPYKRRNNEGSIAQKWRPVDLIKIHLHTKFERNPLRNVAVRALKRHTLYDLWPYKRRNNEGSIAQKWRPVDLIKIHLHTKFERNLSWNVAVRALKRHTLYDLYGYMITPV